MFKGQLSDDKVYKIGNHNSMKVTTNNLPNYAKRDLITINHIYHKYGQQGYYYINHVGTMNNYRVIGYNPESKHDMARLADLHQMERLCHAYMKLTECTKRIMHGELTYFKRTMFYASTFANDFKLYTKRTSNCDSHTTVPRIHSKNIPTV